LRPRARYAGTGIAGTPYYRLQRRRATFDEVAALSVEGLNKSAIDLVLGKVSIYSFHLSPKHRARAVRFFKLTEN